uniref:NADP-dependent oxidoreductase domain-containing protein n=1 Tax=Panagrolaimus sp. ES5 TaxID=591445 RepID=A0AC34FQY1_9BILA
MAKNSVPTLTLKPGIEMPIIGYGTSTVEDQKTLEKCIEAALEAGYRHFDTAFTYGNEEQIGNIFAKIFKNGKYKREEIFLTTKLPSFWHSRDDAKLCVEKQLKALQMEYIDLYLIHSPCPCKKDPEKDAFLKDSNGKVIEEEIDLLETWKALEEIEKDGKIKSLGVSNFNEQQLLHLYKNAQIKPVNNQVECHVLFPQNELHEFCKKHGIILTAYSPIGSPGRPEDTVEHPEINQLEHSDVIEIAKKHAKTPAQILLRHLVERGISAIPKSVTLSRIQENIDIFDFSLDSEDIKKLEALGPHKRIFTHRFNSEHSNYPYNDLK